MRTVPGLWMGWAVRTIPPPPPEREGLSLPKKIPILILLPFTLTTASVGRACQPEISSREQGCFQQGRSREEEPVIFPEEIPDQICCPGEARGKGLCAVHEKSSLPHFMLTFTTCSQGRREVENSVRKRLYNPWKHTGRRPDTALWVIVGPCATAPRVRGRLSGRAGQHVVTTAQIMPTSCLVLAC